jgi:hypothetical protein
LVFLLKFSVARDGEYERSRDDSENSTTDIYVSDHNQFIDLNATEHVTPRVRQPSG